MKLLIAFFVCLCFLLSTEVFACAVPIMYGPDQVNNSINAPNDGIGEFTISLSQNYIDTHQGFVSTQWTASGCTLISQTGEDASFYFNIQGPPASFRIVTVKAVLTFGDGSQYTCTQEVLATVSY